MADQSDKPQSELFLEYALRMTKSRLRIVGFFSAALLILTTAAAMILLIVVGDHVFTGGLPLWARHLLRWTLVLGLLALIVWTIVIPLARRINDLYVARIIEKANPEFRNDLTAALQLTNDPHAHVAAKAAVNAGPQRKFSPRTSRVPWPRGESV